jgi:hypothetical protein
MTHESEEKKPMVVSWVGGDAAQERTEVSVCGLLRRGQREGAR